MRSKRRPTGDDSARTRSECWQKPASIQDGVSRTSGCPTRCLATLGSEGSRTKPKRFAGFRKRDRAHVLQHRPHQWARVERACWCRPYLAAARQECLNLRISRAAFVSRRLASGVRRISPLHQCVPRITISVMRSSSPRWLIVTPPACSIALRHSWLDISGGNAHGGSGVTFLAMILRAALVSATFSARPNSRSPHTQFLPLASTGRSMTTCRPCTIRGIPACRRHQAHCRAVRQALIDISAIVLASLVIARPARRARPSAKQLRGQGRTPRDRQPGHTAMPVPSWRFQLGTAAGLRKRRCAAGSAHCATIDGRTQPGRARTRPRHAVSRSRIRVGRH